MGALGKWVRGRRATASVVSIALIAGIPLAFAVLHPGFPVSNIQLNSRDVWVTNASTLQAGRLNRQINLLDGSVLAGSNNFDVFQNGDSVFVQDSNNNTLKRIDPSFTTAVDSSKLLAGSTVSYGGDVLAILAPDTGKLWRVQAASKLSFDVTTATPILKLGRNSQAVVGQDGTIYAVSGAGALYRIDPTGRTPQRSTFPALSSYQLSVVGTHPVVLDTARNLLLKEDGSTLKLPAKAMRIQQPGADSSYTLVATVSSLLRIDLGGNGTTNVDAKLSVPATSADQIAAPVHLDGCDHGAWSSAQRYFFACVGKQPLALDISQDTRGDKIEFRVNRSVIALNDLRNGNSWLVDSKLKLVSNWADVAPPKDNSDTQSQQKVATTTFEEVPWKPSPQNHPPVAHDDSFGARAGVTTLLPVLNNDVDPDGDVLTITNVGTIPASFGTLQLVDGGRALQFSPEQNASGSVSFRYGVTDGRPGGVADAAVTLAIHPASENSPPVSQNSPAVIVEAGHSVSYNVLADWTDPDGDPLQLTAASVASGDSVRYTPDGFISFQSISSQLGIKQVSFTVEDTGKLSATGTLSVDVKAPSTVAPIAIQDFATGFVGDTISVSPLANDRSPSGQPLRLLAVSATGTGASVTPNLDAGTVQVSAGAAGTYYLQYTLAAGTSPLTSLGLIRVDVANKPAVHLPPIAVTDIAYLRGTDSITVPVLANDISPSGAVLGIQTINVPPTSSVLRVEILSSTVLRITATSPLTAPLQIGYTVSDGSATASATVTIVPVPPLISHQAPVASDDNVTVRAGNVASVSVLANDFDPDGAHLSLAPQLVDWGTEGLAFVSGDQVRYQAPNKPGQYAVVYKVISSSGESATARVIFTVTAPDDKTNRAPLPTPIEARVFSGATVRVVVPLDGIDPDGDSVILNGLGNPQLGQIADQSSAYFDYTAAAGSFGTDTFDYQVVDSLGKTATGTVRIGIIPRAGILPPTAVDDSITMRPSREGSVDVLANDSDANGYAISVDPGSLRVDKKGITASVVDNQVAVQSGASEGSYNVSYSITDGHGQPSSAVIHVVVSKTAPEQPPTAMDHVLQQKEIAGKTTVTVNALDRAQDPGGLVKDLTVALIGPDAQAATIAGKGQVIVTPSKSGIAIAYTLTNGINHLSSTAFIFVPAIPKPGWNQIPFITKNLPAQVVDRNSSRSWSLKDIVTTPSGAPVHLTGKQTVTATNSDGSPVYVDATTLKFTAANGYSGPAAINFEVTDGANTVRLTLPITVGDPSFRDVPPTFSNVTVSVPEDGTAQVSLRGATSHPSPQILQAINYASAGGTPAVQGQLSGATLTISADKAAPLGSTVIFQITLKTDRFTVTGRVTATVVSTLKPLAQAVTDTLHAQRAVVTVVSPLTNDVNPFPSTPLKIVGATLENPASGAAVSFTDSTVTVTPGPSFIGDVSVLYTVQDATPDPSRRVTGRIIVTVWDVPDKPAAPTIVGSSDGQATIRFNPPPSINGSPVTSYAVRSSPAVTPPTCNNAGADCTFTGLTNGTAYVFYVNATNGVGTSQESNASASVTPYRQPSAPTSASLSAGGYAPTTLTMTWGTPADSGGGRVTYNWKFIAGSTASGGPVSGNTAYAYSMGAGTYQFQVQACNPAGCSGWTSSGPVGVSDPPPPPPPPVQSVVLSKGAPEGGTAYYFHIEARNFAANAKFSVGCHIGTTSATAGYTAGTTNALYFDGSGNFSGDVSCWDGYHNNDYAVINGVTSNTTSW